MGQISVNIRMDEDLKRKADALFADIGLNMTTAVTAFVRRAVDYDGIPFELRRRRAESAEAMQEALRLLYDPAAKTYSSAKELFDELNAEIAAEVSADV